MVASAKAGHAEQSVHLIVTRQDGPDGTPYQEEFKIPYRKNMNVISAFMEIQRNPVNAKGEKVAPIQWESNCLEEVCGACSMVINGRPRQACTALIDKLKQPIRIEPMKTFPVIRDLIVDRGRMFDALKRVKAWIPIDGTHDLGPGPRQGDVERQWRYELSKCMTCGVCLEACPNVNTKSSFVGPFVVGQVQLFNSHPTGALNKEERLEAMIGEGGVQECGNSQNCVQACPKGIPLTTAIAATNRAASKYMFKKWLSF
ncbi:succinate dehydrogenase iron-sulfur subunit [Paenactinomyces guangxiensis]|uniref:succinate dehydrogenase n=1 Tax=Paenactinomyces guangxiensis TaxID=1490290 RepID=A0A7W1WRG7_9BACL|nr:succinate dehydrogenase iron-sulfur subunit [Paenactinomyces guangxiensis]MBA4494617.1 succinate dehydrogenase iron-sulfur subunit [Paenactinomyces guangxiensis]MBH8591620.1 succinate dehydrogenase iron-sulfur subunit [Paenactinomyces guangxiensis]